MLSSAYALYVPAGNMISVEPPLMPLMSNDAPTEEVFVPSIEMLPSPLSVNVMPCTTLSLLKYGYVIRFFPVLTTLSSLTLSIGTGVSGVGVPSCTDFPYTTNSRAGEGHASSTCSSLPLTLPTSALLVFASVYFLASASVLASLSSVYFLLAASVLDTGSVTFVIFE